MSLTLDMTRRGLLGAAVAGAALSKEAVVARPATEVGLAARFRDEIDRLAREEDFTGTILLSHHGKILLHRAWGLADRNHAVPNRIDTRFHTASIGKLFTSLAIMRLVADGKIALENSLAECWPGYPNAAASKATIAQLLSHTAGFGNPQTILPSYVGPPLLTNADYFRQFVNEPLQQPPGTGFAYSNNGFVVLGLLIERLSGESYFSHISRTIWQPLKMVDTGPERMDFATPRAATGYFRAPDAPGRWQNNIDPRMPVGSAFGGLYSTAADLDRFGAAMAAGTLLPPELMRQWTTGRYPYHRGSYGLGASEVIINGVRVIGHSGGHFGVAGELMVWPESGYCLTILSNSEPEAYFSLLCFAKQQLCGALDDISRNYLYSCALAKVFIEKGRSAALAMHAERATGTRLSEATTDALALREIHRGRQATGLALLRFNAELFPASSGPYWSLAEAYRHAGDKKAAVEAYHSYLQREPNDIDAKRWVAILSEA